MEYSNKEKQLFNEIGIHIEDRNYTEEEREKFKIKVTDYIMSQSSKDIGKLTKKFGNILYQFKGKFMKIKVFDVVKLNNGNNATILEKSDKATYKAEIVNSKGKTEGIIQISGTDIIEVIFSKQE